MSSLSDRLLPALTIHVAIHLVLFTLTSWVILSTFLGYGPVTVLVGGVSSTLVAIVIEWLVGPGLVSSLLRPRWIEREDDFALWSLVQGEADRAGVKVGQVGVLDIDAPDSLAYASLTGRPVVLLTRGLLVDLTYKEVRVNVAYLLGCSKSGVLGVMTALSGLLVLSNWVASGYIESRFEEEKAGVLEIIRAGWGYLIFALVYPQVVFLSRGMSIYGDEFSIRQTGDPSSFFSALLKVATGLALNPLTSIRTSCAPLKGLMFQDPSSVLRDVAAIKEAARKYDINLNRLLGYEPVGLLKGDEPRLHVFERFWVQPSLSDRLGHGMEFGGECHYPIRIGLDRID
jgi:Zn-dependent protease with chaperone function